MCPDKDKETEMVAFNFNVEEVNSEEHPMKKEASDIQLCEYTPNVTKINISEGCT
jgi:hypothetical protein